MDGSGGQARACEQVLIQGTPCRVPVKVPVIALN